jgi:hypothetical protein
VDPVPGFVERVFRRSLPCGILTHGLARAHYTYDTGSDID